MTTKLLSADVMLGMTGSALVAHYNQLVEEHPELEIKPVNRFASTEVAQRRLASLYASIKGAAADDGRSHEAPSPGSTTIEEKKTASASAEAEPSEATATDKPIEESKMAAAKKKTTTKTPKKAAEPVARGFAEDAVIKVLVKENPRRGDAAKRFEIYKNGMTVAEYTKKIGSRAEALVHLRWDVNHEFISVK